MSAAQTRPVCPAGVTAQTLSAWRDDTLPPAEAGRLMAHCASCVACQERLARYADLAVMLRAQPLPGPDGRLVEGVQTRLRAWSTRTAGVARGGRLWRRGVGGLSALAAALLLVTGFAQLFRMTATHTPVAGTPQASMVVAWHAATFPAGFVVPAPANQSLATRSLDVAPGDGNTAYACMAPAQGQRTQPVIWVTHDRTAHWAERARVPVVGKATNCLITVDLVDPAVAVVDVLEANAADDLFITFDGAATWQSLAGTGLTELARTATLGGYTYALARGQWFSGAMAQTRLVVTADRFAHVRTIDSAIAGQAGTDTYWINAANGTLLARTQSGLWQTHDGGATWARLALPAGVSAQVGMLTVAVQAPTENAPWHLCLDASHPTTQPYGPNTNTLYCTADGGRTWGAPRSGQPTTFPLVARLDGMALAADGAVLAVLPNTGAATPASLAVTYTLWRLPMGSSTWHNLGTVPAPNVVYTPEPGRGVLWAVGSPELAMRAYGALSNEGYSTNPAIYVATYS